LRTGDIANKTTDSDGEYIIDLANFPTFAQVNNDPLLIRSYRGGKLFAFAEIRVTLKLGIGSLENQDMTLVPEFPEQPKDNDQKVMDRKEHHTTENAKKTFSVGERQYAQKFSKLSGTQQVEYQGWAEPGSKNKGDKPIWRIRKLLYDGTFTEDIVWAQNNTNFDKTWNDRESYKYG